MLLESERIFTSVGVAFDRNRLEVSTDSQFTSTTTVVSSHVRTVTSNGVTSGDNSTTSYELVIGQNTVSQSLVAETELGSGGYEHRTLEEHALLTQSGQSWTLSVLYQQYAPGQSLILEVDGEGGGSSHQEREYDQECFAVADLTVSGWAQPLGVTDTQPFWSEDRQQFEVAGRLRVGERLRNAAGEPVRIARIAPRTGPPAPVHNLEVDAEHVYHVGSGGVLVHYSYKKDITHIAHDLGTGLPYIGRASGTGTPQQSLLMRYNSHDQNSIYPVLDSFSDSSAANRGREQELINALGGIENLAKWINGVSNRDPLKYKCYLEQTIDVASVR